MKHVVLSGHAEAPVAVPPELEICQREFAVSRPTPPPASTALCAALLRCRSSAVYIVDRLGILLWSNQDGQGPFHDKAVAPTTGSNLGDHWSCSPTMSFAQGMALANKCGNASLSGSTRISGRKRWWDIELTRIDGDPLCAGQLAVVVHEVAADRTARVRRAPLFDDGRTGLAQPGAFHLRLDALAAAANPSGFSVIMTDINRFRKLNDDFGREVGDQILRILGQRIGTLMRPGDMAARLGGDEFGMLLCGDNRETRAEAILGALRLPIRVGGFDVDCAISAGFASYPEDGASVQALVHNAEAALYESKLQGDGATVHFDSNLRQSDQARRAMIARAEFALSSDGIVPHYQPKVDLSLGTVVGLEALLRWRSEAGTLELPGAIWAAFDDPQLSRRISEVMLDQILRDIVQWRSLGIDLPVSVNVSDADLRQGDFADRLLGKLAFAGVPASAVEVEITETVLLGREQAHLARMLDKLNAAQVRIALDDFGTGYASLSHLKQLPVDVIKIDRSFVRNLRDDPGDCAIVEAMLAMARKLAIEVVAEGIEHEFAVRFLQERGCQMGQGFLFSKAIAADAVPSLQAFPAIARGRASKMRAGRAD